VRRSTQVAGGLIGVLFGFMLCWSGMPDPDVIRSALLLEDAYMYFMFASAVSVAAAGVWLLRRRRARAVLTHAPCTWQPEGVQRRHVVGSLVFGLGWGIADACPGPIATQVGQAIPWALFTLAGVTVGVWAFLRRSARETEPA
jgi:uncharacterized protein